MGPQRAQEVRRRDEARAEADRLRSALEAIVEAYDTDATPVLERMYLIAVDALGLEDNIDWTASYAHPHYRSTGPEPDRQKPPPPPPPNPDEDVIGDLERGRDG